MPTFARMSVSPEINSPSVKWALATYAVLSLISMATMSIGAALLTVVLIASSYPEMNSLWGEFRSTLKFPPVKTYLLLSAVLTLSCALSLIWGLVSPLTYGGHGVAIRFFNEMAKSWYLFWPWIILVALRRVSENDRRFVFQSWIAAFTILSGIGILQHFTGWPRPQVIPGTADPIRFHATLFLGHHLSVASIFIFPLFAALDWGSLKTSSRLPMAIAVLLGCATLFLTYSRTLWIALPVGMLVWIVWSLPKRFKAQFTLLFFLGILALSQFPTISHRLHDGMGIGERKDLWLANLEFFKERPFTGVGWRYNQELSGIYLTEKNHSTNVFSGHAHNNFLDMLGGTGLLGTIAWLAWSFWVFFLLLRSLQLPQSPNQIQFSRGLVCAWIVFHINGLTQVNFWEGKVQHQMAWVIAWSLLWICTELHPSESRTPNHV